MPRYTVIFIALATIGIGGVMSWVTLRYFMRMFTHGGAVVRSSTAVQVVPASAIASATLKQDVLSDFAQAAKLAKSGDITGAEVQVDQAVSEMEAARVRSVSAPVAFYGEAVDALNAVGRRQLSTLPSEHPTIPSDTPSQALADPGQPPSPEPDMLSERLFQHVSQARIELAALRSSTEPTPPGSSLAADLQAHAANVAAEADGANAAAAQAGESSDAPQTSQPRSAAAAQIPKLPAGHVLLNAPRELAVKALLDPAVLGGNFLDASMMPDTVEVLLPPETRQLSDNVRVEDVAIAGASQTLDGIHWRDVTFIGTRLRYEDGQLDLQNVRFVRCTFGFPSDERGATVANAIALGKTSIAFQ
jgi:hypothetical protein